MESEQNKLARLVQSAQGGDKDALESLYISYSKRVYYLALKILRNKNELN